MRNLAFAARSHIGSVVLCTLVSFGLAACGSDAESSASADASTTSDSLVSPSVGLIDRSSEVATNTTQVTAPASNSSTPPSNSTTPTSNSATPPSNSTPVASNGTGSTTPVTGNPPKSGSTGTATLDWTPPTENTDGSTLTNLAGYTVYYGTSPDSLTESVKVSNPGLTAYTLSNLPPGTWYFAVTSRSSTGVESSRSGVISAKI